jgi:hypothetical protein
MSSFYHGVAMGILSLEHQKRGLVGDNWADDNAPRIEGVAETAKGRALQTKMGVTTRIEAIDANGGFAVRALLRKLNKTPK